MRQSVTIGGVEVSKPNKVLFDQPESNAVTKAGLAQYYADIAEVMLPHVRDRPISMQRFPEGISAPGFYEKKAPGHFPDFVATTAVETAEGQQTQILVNNARTLVYLADQACITPHTWPAVAEHLRRPDQLIFDLDPSVPGLRAVRRATEMVGDLLAELDLTGYLKTTGSRGYHVVVPIRPAEHFDQVREFARAMAQVLVQRDPGLLTLEARKSKRGERVLVDIARNAYAQTAAPPYAARARHGAPVATPITWAELSGTAADGYTITSVRRRLAQRSDPWHAMGRHRQSLARARERLAALMR